MKAGIFYTAAIVGTLLAAPALAQDMTVTLTDPVWNGKKVPASQVCERFGGKGAVSPSMLVSNLPDGVVAIDVWFSDDNNERMNWGGHGKVKYIVPAGSTSFELKSFPGTWTLRLIPLQSVAYRDQAHSNSSILDTMFRYETTS